MEWIDSFEEYLNKRNEIIRPALTELADDFSYRKYKVEIVEGRLEGDILAKELNEKLSHLLGQIALKIYKEDNSTNCIIIIGYIGGEVQIINPKTDNSTKVSLETINKSQIKLLTKEKLNI